MDNSIIESFAQVYPTPKRTNINDIDYKIIPKISNKKKTLISLILSLLALFMFSEFAYTISDHISSSMGFVLFGDNGEPKLQISVIHCFIFFMIAWLILSASL